MTAADDLRLSFQTLKGFADTVIDGLASVNVSLGKISQQLIVMEQQLANLPAEPTGPGLPDVSFAVDGVTDSTIKANWVTDGIVEGWRVGRNGKDVNNTGPWQTVVPANQLTQTFSSLLPGTQYILRLEPILSTGAGPAVTLEATTKMPTAPPDPGTPNPPTSGDHGPMALSGGWKERSRDDFNGAALDTSKWGTYNSAGHGGKGLRRPSQFSIVDDATAMGGRCLRVQGTADGTTGGMANKTGQRFGRWGVRMRFPRGDKHYHPVLLTWPDAENWPTGGEIDFAEGNASSDKMQFFLHYSKNNNQTSGDVTVDTTKWHWYEVEWGPDGVRGWCDGQKFFEDTNRAHFNYDGFGSHHGTIQLDWFPDGAKTTGTAEMYVDVYRVYSM